MSNVIPFPRQPRCAQETFHRPEFAKAYRADGTPVAVGDKVRITVGRAAGQIGTVIQEGMAIGRAPRQTYSILLSDGTRFLGLPCSFEHADTPLEAA